MTRRRILWCVLVVVTLLASWLLARRLAVQDPISEVLLGRAGTTLPLAAIVLLLRLGLIVVSPVVVSIALVRAAVRRMHADPDEEKRT